MSNSEKFVYILILNWNGWADTIECLESIFKSTYTNYKVIVCDNDSKDGSLEKIRFWAEGKLNSYVRQDNKLKYLSFPPIYKPIKYVDYEYRTAEMHWNAIEFDSRLILIQTGGNLGFAGGNNVGLKYILTRPDFHFVWLLNNDTAVSPDALTALVNKMNENSSIGICGATLLDYNAINIVQALGGATYNPWLATSKHLGAGLEYSFEAIKKIGQSKFSYIVGASMFVSREFLLSVGFMEDSFFLYYEELDWAVRAKKKFLLSYASDALVYHKEGSSIGSSWDPMEKSDVADYYSVRNRLLITMLHYKFFLPIVYLSLWGVLINRVRRSQLHSAMNIFKIIMLDKEPFKRA